MLMAWHAVAAEVKVSSLEEEFITQAYLQSPTGKGHQLALPYHKYNSTYQSVKD